MLIVCLCMLGFCGWARYNSMLCSSFGIGQCYLSLSSSSLCLSCWLFLVVSIVLYLGVTILGLDEWCANLRWAIWTGGYWMKTSCTICRRWWCYFNRSLNATGRRSFSLWRRRHCWCLVCCTTHNTHTYIIELQ